MSVRAVTTFFALLAVLAIVVIVVVAGLWLWSRLRGGLPPAIEPWRDGAAQVALPAAFAVALTCTLGSLYLSEVAGFPPCELCWYQRIAMYPLSVLLGIATFRRDVSVAWYVVPIATIGAAVSTYHYLVERFPDTVTSSCDVDVPCSTVWVWKFHFLSIPGMAWVGFVTIIALTLLAASSSHPRRSPTSEEAPT